jgi:hypothetical protein
VTFIQGRNEKQWSNSDCENKRDARTNTRVANARRLPAESLSKSVNTTHLVSAGYECHVSQTQLHRKRTTRNSRYTRFRRPHIFAYPRFYFNIMKSTSASISAVPSTTAGEPVARADAPVQSSLPSPTSFESPETEDSRSRFQRFPCTRSRTRPQTHAHNKSSLYFLALGRSL